MRRTLAICDILQNNYKSENNLKEMERNCRWKIQKENERNKIKCKFKIEMIKNKCNVEIEFKLMFPECKESYRIIGCF